MNNLAPLLYDDNIFNSKRSYAPANDNFQQTATSINGFQKRVSKYSDEQLEDFDFNQTKAFLKLLDPTTDIFTFQTFDDDENRKDKSLAHTIHGSFDTLRDDLIELNIDGCGIFVTINETDLKSRKAENIVRIRAIFQDDDDHYTGTFPLPPSIVVRSSPIGARTRKHPIPINYEKIQRYWKVDGVLSETDFETLEEILVSTYGADKNAKDIARVFRLPGFFHQKDPENPHMVELLISESPRVAYSADKLKEAFLGSARSTGFPRSPDMAQTPKKPLEANQGTLAETGSALVLKKAVEQTSPISGAPPLVVPGQPNVKTSNLADLVRSALAVLPVADFANNRACWLDYSFALINSANRGELSHDEAKDIWDKWSSTSGKYNQIIQDEKWKENIENCRKYHGKKKYIESIFFSARKYGWIDTRKKYELTDMGNAERFVDRHGDNIHFVKEWNEWLIWNESKCQWKKDNNFTIVKLAKETIRSIYAEAAKCKDDNKRRDLGKHAHSCESGNRIRSMIDFAKSEDGVTISDEQFDNDINLLGVQNGVIDLKTFEFREDRREDFITKRCGCDYIQKAGCPLWMKFLNQIMNGNQEMILFLQRNDGYMLTGDVDEKNRILWGSGANGKSVYRETKRHVLGDYFATASVALLHQIEKASEATPELARLMGKRHIAINETKEGAKYSTERFKNIASKEPIVARKMYGDTFEFMPTHKIEITTNHKPDVTAVDDGFWRRVLLIPFTYTIPENERNERFREEYLMGELPGILNWMLDGLKQYRTTGLNPPDEVTNAIKEYRNEMDLIQHWIDDRCKVGNECCAPTNILHKDFMNYVKQESGMKMEPISLRKFGDELTNKGYIFSHTKKGSLRKGLALLTPDEVDG
jgi:putative DNA primase/helicase